MCVNCRRWTNIVQSAGGEHHDWETTCLLHAAGPASMGLPITIASDTMVPHHCCIHLCGGRALVLSTTRYQRWTGNFNYRMNNASAAVKVALKKWQSSVTCNDLQLLCLKFWWRIFVVINLTSAHYLLRICTLTPLPSLMQLRSSPLYTLSLIHIWRCRRRG